MSVYKRGEPKPLETFPYEHIIFFGAPQPCTYKITVDEREMFFETPQVLHQNFRTVNASKKEQNDPKQKECPTCLLLKKDDGPDFDGLLCLFVSRLVRSQRS